MQNRTYHVTGINLAIWQIVPKSAKLKVCQCTQRHFCSSHAWKPDNTVQMAHSPNIIFGRLTVHMYMYYTCTKRVIHSWLYTFYEPFHFSMCLDFELIHHDAILHRLTWQNKYTWHPTHPPAHTHTPHTHITHPHPHHTHTHHTVEGPPLSSGARGVHYPESNGHSLHVRVLFLCRTHAPSTHCPAL